MQRVPLLLLLLLAASSGGRARAAAPGSASDPDWLEYVKFLSEHRPNAAERRRLNSHSSTRLAIFKANLRRLEDQQRCDPGATYGVNMFTDLSEEEFNSMYVSGHQHWNETIAKYRASGETGHTPGVATNFTYRRQLSGGSIDWRYHMGGKVRCLLSQSLSASISHDVRTRARFAMNYRCPM